VPKLLDVKALKGSKIPQLRKFYIRILLTAHLAFNSHETGRVSNAGQDGLLCSLIGMTIDKIHVPVLQTFQSS